MTREEAIKTLHELWRETNDPWYEEVYNMAIEALNIVMDSENDAVKTEDDVIKRQDAIKTVCRTRCGDKAKGCPAHSCPVIEEFDALPSAEPKTGEWVKRQTIGDVSFAYCSECGEPILHGRTSPLWNFCPNCGARMRGGE